MACSRANFIFFSVGIYGLYALEHLFGTQGYFGITSADLVLSYNVDYFMRVL
jgi:hypothetical protein